MKAKKKDFVEIDFTARTEDGRVFDTTKKEVAKEENLPETEYKPLHICIGEGQLLKGLDKALDGKELGKEYEITINPEEAFGRRDPKLVRIIPLKVFHEKEVNPYPGLSVAIDNTIATVRAVSGGRVITDFNHPLAGRKIIYKIVLRRKLENEGEKIAVILKIHLKTDKFSVKGKEIILEERADDSLLSGAEKKINELIGDFTLKNKGNGGVKEDLGKSSEKKKV